MPTSAPAPTEVVVGIAGAGFVARLHIAGWRQIAGVAAEVRGVAAEHPERAQQFAVLRYGFQFRKTDVVEKTVRASMASVIEETKAQVERADEPLSAVIQGVDDAWEVCLLKFTIDLIERSSGGNLGDFRRRGLV